MRLIKGERIVEDDYHVVDDAALEAEALPAGNVIVPLALWQRERERLLERDGGLGVWLDAHEEPESIARELDAFDVVAVNFPIATDGRGLSSAVLLRTRFGFRGELRAIGDVLRDQLSYMRRCGFDAFAVPVDRDVEAALTGLTVMREYYQGSVIEPEPLFRRVARD